MRRWILIGLCCLLSACSPNKDLNENATESQFLPEVKAKAKELSIQLVGNSPAEFGAVVGRDRERWARSVGAAGITAD